jgi:tetratricopeptide (TPR) repeat protein
LTSFIFEAMYQRCLLLLAIVIIVSCNNSTKENELLTNAPYNKLTDSIHVAPDNPELYYHRGGLLYSNNQQELSENDLRKAWALQPKEEYALSLVTVLKQKNTDSALLFIQQALKTLPNSIALQIGEARGLQQKKLTDSALHICDRIIKQYPGQIDALLLKSDLLKEQNKIDEALSLKERAFILAPMDRDLAYDLAYDYAEAKNSNVLKLADYLISRDSTQNVAKAYYVKATYYNNINNTADALKNYNAAIVADYNFMDAYLDKGRLLLTQNKLSEAEKTFRLALRISPATADFYYWLAKTEEAKGKKAEAALDYQRAYGLDHEMKEAKDAAKRLAN